METYANTDKSVGVKTNLLYFTSYVLLYINNLADVHQPCGFQLDVEFSFTDLSKQNPEAEQRVTR